VEYEGALGQPQELVTRVVPRKEETRRWKVSLDSTFPRSESDASHNDIAREGYFSIEVGGVARGKEALPVSWDGDTVFIWVGDNRSGGATFSERTGLSPEEFVTELGKFCEREAAQSD
jgi:hypothetical protein